MKSVREAVAVGIMGIGLIGFIGYSVFAPDTGIAAPKAQKGSSAVVSVAPQVTKLAKTVSVDIIGKGYTPDQEVRILFTDAEGMQTDIGYALDPAPKANKSGAWITTWKCDEFIKAGLVQPGAFTLTVTDNDFKTIAQTDIFFSAGAGMAKKKKK